MTTTQIRVSAYMDAKHLTPEEITVHIAKTQAEISVLQQHIEHKKAVIAGYRDAEEARVDR